jgi:toxin YoeB
VTLSWHPDAWEDYIEWQRIDKNIAKRINELIKECLRTPRDGKGKPEMLRSDFSGYWSRRITEEHRLVYKIEKDCIIVVQCRYHY